MEGSVDHGEVGNRVQTAARPRDRTDRRSAFGEPGTAMEVNMTGWDSVPAAG